MIRQVVDETAEQGHRESGPEQAQWCVKLRCEAGGLNMACDCNTSMVVVVIRLVSIDCAA
jgi:hypothetical protein